MTTLGPGLPGLVVVVVIVVVAVVQHGVGTTLTITLTFAQPALDEPLLDRISNKMGYRERQPSDSLFVSELLICGTFSQLR